jgi:hypothetical protein
MTLRQLPTLSPLFDPFFDALSDRLLKASEVAEHLRYSEQHLANMRRAGRHDFLPWVELPGGAIRYRLADVARAQILGQRGPLTVERACQAIATAPNMTAEAKAAATAVLLRAFPDL